MSKDNLEQKEHLIDLMNMETDKELAMALVDKYKSTYELGGVKYKLTQDAVDARECAKLDLQHSIELLEWVLIKVEDPQFTIQEQLQSLRNQLEHLNSI